MRTTRISAPAWRSSSASPDSTLAATARTGTGVDDPRDAVDDAAEVAIAVRLDQLLPGVQVQRDRVGADLRGERGDLWGPHRERLDGSEIAEQEHVGRDVADLVAGGELGVLGHRALRADAERDPGGLRGTREIAIDGGRFRRAAGHAGDY